MKKMTAIEMELALVQHFNPRANLIIPNVSWGMFRHELDLFVLTKAGYGYEIEIKVSKSDLKKDLTKKHGHRSDKIKYLYFAIPDYLADCIEYVPDRAGVLVTYEDRGGITRFKEVRPAKKNCDYKFSEREKFQAARLGALRIWGLKRKLVKASVKA